MLKGIKNILRRIREGDEQNKKKWIIGMTILAMIAVMTIWLVYLKFTMLLSYEKATSAPTESVNFDWQGKVQQFKDVFSNAKSKMSELSSSTNIR